MTTPVCYFTTLTEAQLTLAQLPPAEFEVEATHSGYALVDKREQLPAVVNLSLTEVK